MRHFVLCLLASATFAANATGDSDDGAWTPITTDLESVGFAGDVGGREVRIRLGSASPSNSVNETFVQSLPNAAEVTPEGLALRDLPHLVDLPLLITSRRIVLPRVYRLDDMPFDVHAGRDFFSGHIVQIDYPNRRLRALDQDALALRDIANVPARRIDQSLGTLIQIDVAGQAVWAVLATEYSGALMIPRSLALKHDWLQDDDLEMGAVQDAYGNEYVNEGFRLTHVNLGPYRVEGIDAVIMEDGESPLAGDSAQETVILGNHILRHFQLSIDLDRAYVHVQTPSEE